MHTQLFWYSKLLFCGVGTRYPAVTFCVHFSFRFSSNGAESVGHQVCNYSQPEDLMRLILILNFCLYANSGALAVMAAIVHVLHKRKGFTRFCQPTRQDDRFQHRVCLIVCSMLHAMESMGPCIACCKFEMHHLLQSLRRVDSCDPFHRTPPQANSDNYCEKGIHAL